MEEGLSERQLVALGNLLKECKDAVGEKILQFVTDEDFKEWIKHELVSLYPDLYDTHVVRQTLEEELGVGDTLEIPAYMRRISEIRVLVDGTNNLSIPMLITGFNIVVSTENKDAMLLQFDADCPKGVMVVTGDGPILMDIENETFRIENTTPVVSAVTARYYTRLRAEALRNRDNTAYTLYNNALLIAENKAQADRRRYRMLRMAVRVKPDATLRRNATMHQMNDACTLPY